MLMKFGKGDKNANLSLNTKSFVTTLSVSGDMTSQISIFTRERIKAIRHLPPGNR